MKEWAGWGAAAIAVVGGIMYVVYEVGQLKGRLDLLDVDELRQHEARVREMLATSEKSLKNAQRRWCDLTSKRTEDVWYRTDASEIELSVRIAESSYGRCQVAVDIDTEVPPAILAQSWTDGRRCTLQSVTIPANTGYRVDYRGTLATWWELREQCPD